MSIRECEPGWRTMTLAVICLAVMLSGCGGGGGDGTADREAGDRDAAARDTARGAADADTLTITGGFQTPESVVWDSEADVYLVSNINGDPFGKDDNGFISRVLPDGRIEALKWIDGESPRVRLHAPKGLAMRGDTLFVADIDTVRAFDRRNGQPLGAWGVPDAGFLNDLAADDHGLYVTDSGLAPGFTPSQKDAVYRLRGAQFVPLARNAELKNPNGVVADRDSLTYVGFGANMVYRLDREEPGPVRQVATLPGGQLDGLVRLSDGTLLVSSWETSTVYRVPADGGPVTAVVEGVTSPADIGWDDKRDRVLIPLFQNNRIVVRKIG